MPLYTITRDVTGLSDADIDAAAMRAIICLYAYPDMRWIRSYLDRSRGELLCLYQAASPAEILEHSERSRIPVGEIREVEEIVPEHFFAGAEPPVPA